MTLSTELERLSAAATPGGGYLIRKGAYWYRPNAQGYTASPLEAGRYSLDEAEQLTHPNGKDGPRDGLTFIHEADVPGAALEAAETPLPDDVAGLVERLRALHVWPQFVADDHADVILPRQSKGLYAVGTVAHEAADTITALSRQLAERDAEIARLREALISLRDCDWVISLPDRMDAVRDIARRALENGHD